MVEMQKFKFDDSWKEMQNWWFKSLGEHPRIMNKAQEQIKKLKSHEIQMEQCICVEHEWENCREMWIDEMVMELGVWWFEWLGNHPRSVHNT